MAFVRCGVAGLLVLAALVQLNDPDPLQWIAYYVVCAALLLVAAKRPKPSEVVRYLAIGMILIAVVWCASILHTGAGSIEELTGSQLMQGMSNVYPGNELLKELGGLVICSIALYALILRVSCTASSE